MKQQPPTPAQLALNHIDAAIDSLPHNSIIRRRMLKIRTAWAAIVGARSRVGAKPLGDEVRDKIVTLHAAGRDVKEIAAEVGCSLASVYRLRKQR